MFSTGSHFARRRFDSCPPAGALPAAAVVGVCGRVPAAVSVLFAVVIWSSLPGCGTSDSHVDSAPFEAAVAQYLARNDMAMRLKEIREGPSVDGNQATMTASMTHRELGGPSVVSYPPRAKASLVGI